MTKFLLIRHATTAALGKSLSGRMQDVQLDVNGQQQARQLAKRLAALKIDAIYSSPLERTLETAAPLAEQMQLPCSVAEELVELDFGDWTNCSFTQLADDPTFKRFNTFRSITRIPGGETMQEAQTRLITGLERLAKKHPNEVVAVFSHSDMIKSAVAYYAGIHLDLFQRLEISPASVSVIDLFDDTARIVCINDTGTFGV
jgi:probable phosphomutase (TIGR03848 family)